MTEQEKETIALEWLMRTNQQLDAERQEYVNQGNRYSDSEGYNQRRRIKLLTALKVVLDEFGYCGRCLHYDTSYNICNFPLPLAYKGVTATTMSPTDGAGCPCWTKKN